MHTLPLDRAHDIPDTDWKPFPGGELEGRQPAALCPACRARRRSGGGGASRGALCFQCYRSELEHNRQLKAAASLQTASEARFQTSLPFEPVNRPRLARLKAEREDARVRAREGSGIYVERRVRAQVEARHTLARILQGLRERQLVGPDPRPASRTEAGARGGGLQLPESWLPFVVSR